MQTSEGRNVVYWCHGGGRWWCGCLKVHLLTFGLLPSIVSGVILTLYSQTTVWPTMSEKCGAPAMYIYSMRNYKAMLSSQKGTLWFLYGIELMLANFNSVSLPVCFNIVLWRDRESIGVPQIYWTQKWDKSTKCLYICRLWSFTVLFKGYPKSVCWRTLKISCSCPSLCMSAPPIHHLTLAGAETLDKPVGNGSLSLIT